MPTVNTATVVHNRTGATIPEVILGTLAPATYRTMPLRIKFPPMKEQIDQVPFANTEIYDVGRDHGRFLDPWTLHPFNDAVPVKCLCVTITREIKRCAQVTGRLKIGKPRKTKRAELDVYRRA